MASALWRLDATALAALIRTGCVSAREAVEAHLDRLQAVNPQINAVVRVLADEARAEADRADAQRRAGEALGPLHGVPVTTKINSDQAGCPTDNGVVRFKDLIASREARLARVQALNHGLGASIVMDLVGNAGILEEAIPMLRSGGRFVQIGAMAADQSASIFPGQLLRGKTIMGSLMYRPYRIPTLLTLLAKQDLPFDRIVSAEYKLEDVNRASAEVDWQSRATDVTRAVLVT